MPYKTWSFFRRGFSLTPLLSYSRPLRGRFHLTFLNIEPIHIPKICFYVVRYNTRTPDCLLAESFQVSVTRNWVRSVEKKVVRTPLCPKLKRLRSCRFAPVYSLHLPLPALSHWLHRPTFRLLCLALLPAARPPSSLAPSLDLPRILPTAPPSSPTTKHAPAWQSTDSLHSSPVFQLFLKQELLNSYSHCLVL